MFARVRRALAIARRSAGLPALPRALTRRQALILGGAGIAAACTTTGKPSANAARTSVAIVGGGVAGLTVAYRLAEAGWNPGVFEASPRFGGRMFTKRNFTAEGQFCELGGELVDTGHAELMDLAEELGVGVERLAPEDDPGEDVYDLGGAVKRLSDFIDPATGTGAFIPLARVIAADQAALLDADENWTARARELDAMSLEAYLAKLRPLTEDWAIAALDLAYLGEYGLPSAQQSALNLIDVIGTGTEEEFAVYGESDEAFRIAGGSSSLPEALVAAIGGRARLAAKHELISVSRAGEDFSLAFRTPDGQTSESARHVVFALPFTRLRQTTMTGVALSPQKLRAIAELGYGTNAKLMVATKSRPWKEPRNSLPIFGGAVYSDRGFQLAWETSRGQKGKGGVLTNFLSGEAGFGEEAAAYNMFECGMQELAPYVAESFDPKTRVSMFWPRHPQVMGSYSCPKVGQYTTLLEVAGTPEAGGRVHFAGEHTSPEYLGFMNGAVSSGERVARAILEG
jgi:monoamine oxidase